MNRISVLIGALFLAGSVVAQDPVSSPELVQLTAQHAQAQAEYDAALARLKQAEQKARGSNVDPRAMKELYAAKEAHDGAVRRLQAAGEALEKAKAGTKPGPVPRKTEGQPPVVRPVPPTEPLPPKGGEPRKPREGGGIKVKGGVEIGGSGGGHSGHEGHGEKGKSDPPGKAWGHLDKDDPRHPGAKGRMKRLTPKGEAERHEALLNFEIQIKAIDDDCRKSLSETINPLKKREIEAMSEAKRAKLRAEHEVRLAEIESKHALPEDDKGGAGKDDLPKEKGGKDARPKREPKPKGGGK